MLTLYHMPSSGNSYKVRLLLAMLGKPFKAIGYETGDGTNLTGSDAFRTLNPKGKLPLLVLEDGRTLSESNAILLYMAEGTHYLPGNAYERALVTQWMFFEQYDHEPNVAVRQSLLTYEHRKKDATPEKMAALMAGGTRALNVMEEQLASTPFLIGDQFTVADICLFAYTHCAETGGFDLADYPGISKWLERVASQPGHMAKDWLPKGA